jgi:tetratricopeptide (TPR) repeat protein
MELIPDNINDIESCLEQYNHLKNVYDKAQNIFTNEKKIDSELYINCINRSQKMIKFLDNQNIFIINRYKDLIKNTYLISSELLIRTVGINTSRTSLGDMEKNNLHIAIAHLRKVFSVDPLNSSAKEFFKIVIMYITIFNPNVTENINLLNQILTVDPCDYQLHYNLGFMFHRANQLDNSLYHYKLALGILELLSKQDTNQLLDQFKIKIYNGLGSIYFTVQDRELALYYFNLAYQIDPLDPDINNQIGVIYTELRITDKAIEHYMKGIENFNRSHISTDKDMLIASMYMNMGLVKCYECDFEGAIDGYNKALKYKPRLSLAYQNKLLDLNYISHLIEDPMYIPNLHKRINKIYPKVVTNYLESCPNYELKKSIINCNDFSEFTKSGKKINIGFVSGDFICHPVAYFIHSILKYINYDLFEIHCYSVKVVSLNDMFKNCNWHVVKNKSPEEFKTLIQSHNIDILFDLSAHTGDNRLDTFVLKPAPIQISYCGYPNSSGINSMDYRIVDRYCDSDKSQKYYTEKFIYMENSFLAYTPSMGLENLPQLTENPYKSNGYITFGCFNRYNKINQMVIDTWQKILQGAPNAKFVIKTKEFSTPKLKQQFIDSFTDKSVLDRVTILPYSDTYLEHLPDYNLMDISLDTFPYSGTTTSCESLLMGVPVLTLFDNVRYYHSQNVTTTLMKNSNLAHFVSYSQTEYINKAIGFANNFDKLGDLKMDVRSKFVNGHVCNYTEFVDDFQNKLFITYKKHFNVSK